MWLCQTLDDTYELGDHQVGCVVPEIMQGRTTGIERLPLSPPPSVYQVEEYVLMYQRRTCQDGGRTQQLPRRNRWTREGRQGRRGCRCTRCATLTARLETLLQFS